jgi:uncharacterized damage-inducible protein DinB
MMEDAMSHPPEARETTTLLRYLNSQRRHALDILEGLDDEALRKPVLPSGWTCAGMVGHLAYDIERFWFRAVVAGEQDVIDILEGEPSAWQVGEDMPTATLFDAYRQEIEHANAIIGATPLDAAPAWWPPELFGDFRLDTVREVVLHVITETACHTGHLDAARELIDGRQWLVLTD